MPETELGQYRLLQRLGAGGMGEVFLARLEREEGFEKLLVVKRILPQLSESPRFQEMFSAEARIAASLNHPQVVQVTDFGRIGSNCFLAMEYIDGCDLSSLIEKARGTELPLAFIVAVGQACLRALDYAHRRTPPVVHGDVSPSNVLVGREGELKLTDFGLARISGRGAGTDRPEIQGKLSYMAPEVARGSPANRQSDIFGVGGVLFELATGQPPRKASLDHARNRAIRPVADCKPDVHPALAKVIDRALATNALERFPDASEMEEALGQISTALGLDPGPRTVSDAVASILGDGHTSCSAVPRTLIAPPEPPRRRWSLLATGIFVVIISAAVLVLLSVNRVDPVPEPDAGTQALVAVEEPPVDEPDAGTIRPDNRKPARRDSRRRKIARPVPELIDAGSPEPAPADPVEVAKAPEKPQGFRLQSARPVQCSLDGGAFQATPLSHPQPLSGAHLIKLQEESGFSAAIRMEATGKPGQVKLALRSKPFAVLYIDGRPKGLTPKGGILLGPGEHKISLAPTGKPPMALTLQLH